MDSYISKSGQNIFDIALTLYGTIDGIFDLLASNPESINGEPLTVNTNIPAGTVLYYHSEYVVNANMANWINDNIVKVQNGNHYFEYKTPKDALKQWIDKNGEFDKDTDFGRMTEEEIEQWWELVTRTSLIIKQSGALSSITAKLRTNCAMIIDWGDTTEMEIHTTDDGKFTSEHCYEDSGEHIIRIYGELRCEWLDLSGVSGVYYPINIIYTDAFNSNITDETINSLIHISQ